MFNQTENMIARTEYQQMQNASAEFVEGVEVASEPGWVRRLFSTLTNRKPAKPEKTPAQPTYERRSLQTKHG
jgi:hypothetical protein